MGRSLGKKNVSFQRCTYATGERWVASKLNARLQKLGTGAICIAQWMWVRGSIPIPPSSNYDGTSCSRADLAVAVRKNTTKSEQEVPGRRASPFPPELRYRRGSSCCASSRAHPTAHRRLPLLPSAAEIPDKAQNPGWKGESGRSRTDKYS